LSDPDRSRASRSRALRVSAERVFELARHLTERDRAIALALYEHQLLTTDQLTVLFFSSKRRAQGRLRFLYEEGVVDASTRRDRAGSASRKRTGSWTRPARSSSLPRSAWSANGSAGSAATTGARTRSSCIGWRRTASSPI
jgi:Replication-relaxation